MATSAALHLAPGILILLLHLASGPHLHAAGIPPEVGILAAFVVVLVPLTGWHLSRARQRGQDPVSYRGRLSRRQAWLWVPLLTVWSFVAWGLAGPIDSAIDAAFLGWLPPWFRGMAAGAQQYSTSGIWLALAVNLLINGLLGPVVEEVYFRGFLLPRLSRWGAWAPVLNTALFTLYHLWQPMNMVKIGVAMLPWIYLTWRIQRLRLAIAVHTALNVVGALTSFAMIGAG